MISKKLSLNKVCIILATTILLLSVVMFSVLYILTKEMSVVFCSMAFGLLFLLCVTAFVILIRRKLTLFSEMLCCTLDEMMNGKIDVSQVAEEENLFIKSIIGWCVFMRLCRKAKTALPVNELTYRS